MNLGQAIELLKQGQLITREGWNGKDMYLTISKFIPNDNTSNIPMNIALCNGDKLFVGWAPSQSDLFANDFKIYTKLVDNNKTNNLDFSTALQYVEQGFRVARKGWNGKNQYIFKISCDKFTPEIVKYLEEMTDEFMRPFVHDSMGFMNGTELQVGWIATNTDILSNDWCVISNKKPKPIPESKFDTVENFRDNLIYKEKSEYLEE